MMASFHNGNCPYFLLITKELFKQLLKFVLLCDGLNMAENKALQILHFSDDNWSTRCHSIAWYAWVPVIIVV